MRKGIGLNVIMLLSLSSHQKIYNKPIVSERKAGRSKFTAKAIRTIRILVYAST
jgi:hypothetical protein